MSDKWIAMPRYKLRKILIKKILQRESLNNKTCLEIGYGAGDMLQMYALMGLQVDGYDFSPKAREIAQKRISDDIRLFTDEKDIKKKNYDYLMAFEVIEHIQDDEAVLKQFASYLRNNGKILLSVPAHMSKWAESDITVGHYRRYEKDELKKKLKTANFQPIFFWNYGFPLSIILDIAMNKSYSKNLKLEMKRPREELSKESGIKRKKTILNQILSSDFALFPFYFFQNFFLNFDIGSGYIVFAQKIK